MILCMTRRLNVFYKCMKLSWNTSKDYQVIEPDTKYYCKWSKGNNSKNIQSRVMMVLVHNTLCSRSVRSFSQIALTVFKLQSGQKIAFSYVKRGIIWKINMQELWFLCMTRRLNVLYKCMKFSWNTSKGYQIIEQTCNILCKWSKGNNFKNIQSRVMVFVHDTLCSRSVWKINMQELWFLCMTRRLNVLYKCMKFRWNISNSFQVIEWTWFCDRQPDSQTQGENNMSPDPFRGET